jgi:hypothetical protein
MGRSLAFHTDGRGLELLRLKGTATTAPPCSGPGMRNLTSSAAPHLLRQGTLQRIEGSFAADSL